MAKILLRIPDELHKVITEIAAKNRRATNSEILQAIEYYLEHAPEAQPKESKPSENKPE